jgi:hypothetical protein
MAARLEDVGHRARGWVGVEPGAGVVERDLRRVVMRRRRRRRQVLLLLLLLLLLLRVRVRVLVLERAHASHVQFVLLLGFVVQTRPGGQGR